MQLIINEDRSVEIEDDVFGIIGENKAEVLELVFPAGLENYYKTIEIQSGEDKFVDNIENDKYKLSYAITKYKKVQAQIVAKDLENDIVFKSEIFGIKFKNAINASEQLVEEKKVIIEKIIADVEGIKEENTTQNTEMASIKQQQNEQSTKISSLETAISKITNYDDTELKQEISQIKTNNNNQNTRIATLEDTVSELSNYDDTGLKGEINSIKTNVSNIQAKDMSQDTSIEDLETDLSSLNNTILDKLNNLTNYDDTELKSSIDTANDTLERIEEKINNINVGGSGTTEPSKTNEWQPEPDWWNIEEIINNDTEPYAQKIICLLSDGLDDKATVNQVKRWNKV